MLYSEDLATRELRVPITKDSELFERVRTIGKRLLWLHTYGERFVIEGQRRGRIPPGRAKCIVAVPSASDGYPESFRYEAMSQTLQVGAGGFGPVSREVYDYEVSGLSVIGSWLKYRMKQGAGRKSSALDDVRAQSWTARLTTSLLELLWVLEATVDIDGEQAEAFDKVVEGACFVSEEFAAVPHGMRKAPRVQAGANNLL